MLNGIDVSRFNVVGVVGNREGKKEMVSHADVLGYFKTRRAALSDESPAYLTATPTTRLMMTLEERAWDEKKTAAVVR